MENIQAYSLAQLAGSLRQCLDKSFSGRYWIHAEIAELNVNQYSGHAYLELIEKGRDGQTKAKMRAVIWGGIFDELKHRFEQTAETPFTRGLRVMLLVEVTFNEVYGLSLVVRDIEPSFTLGEAMRRRIETIRRLKENGLFELNRQLPLPRPLQRIAIISSPTAAGYGDFMHHLENSSEGFCFYTHLYPAIMQGEQTANSVLSSLEAIMSQCKSFDVVVLIRGGGSTSDLSAFDSPEIAEAVAGFPLPVLSGIGHERDNTVVDLVATVALKTPTAVADFILAKMREEYRIISGLVSRLQTASRLLLAGGIELLSNNTLRLPHAVQEQKFRTSRQLDLLQASLVRTGFDFIRKHRIRLTGNTQRLPLLEKALLQSAGESLNRLSVRLGYAVKITGENRQQSLAAAEQVIRLAHPESVLKRGYAMVRSRGRVVLRASELPENSPLELRFADASRFVSLLPDTTNEPNHTSP